MKLMCIGASGTELSIVRVDDEGHIDVSDAVRDYDEAFFGSGGPPQLRNSLALDEQVSIDKQQIRRMCVDNPTNS